MKFSVAFQLPCLIDEGESTQFSWKEMKQSDNIIKTEYSIAVLYRQVEKHIRLLLRILIIMSLWHIAQTTLYLYVLIKGFGSFVYRSILRHQ